MPPPRLALGCALLLGACSLVPAPGRQPVSDARVISAAQIERSGARNAWEAIQRSSSNLQTRERFGEPTQLNMRGRSSIALSNDVLVVLDGNRLPDFQRLRDIPAHNVEEIRIYDGLEGTRLFGTGAGNGVITVATRTGG